MATHGKRNKPARSLVHEKGACNEHAVNEVVQSRPGHHCHCRRPPRMRLIMTVMAVMSEKTLEQQEKQNRAQHDEPKIMRLNTRHFERLRDEVRERHCR